MGIGSCFDPRLLISQRPDPHALGGYISRRISGCVPGDLGGCGARVALLTTMGKIIQ